MIMSHWGKINADDNQCIIESVSIKKGIMSNIIKQFPEATDESRICMFSQRQLGRIVSRCGHFEFEDVICEIEHVDMFTPEPRRSFKFGRKVANQLSRHASIICFNPGVKQIRLDKNYDLFFAIFEFPMDLLTLQSIKGWKENCKTSICWVDDLWIRSIGNLKGHLKILSQFDYVLLNCSASVPHVQKIIERPCSYIAPGVDSDRFCPYPNPPIRCVDVYSMGRKSLVTHRSLLELAEQGKIFYIYDTSGKMETFYPQQHRSLIANIAKRSRYFWANIAKINAQSETHGQIEVGFRFFEGAASGTVMLGEPPNNDAFKENFDWPDAVIRVPYDAKNIAEILADLDSQPERIREIRKNSVVQSLLRHDWVYRWRAILDMVGLEPRPALIAREERLKKLAGDIMGGGGE